MKVCIVLFLLLIAKSDIHLPTEYDISSIYSSVEQDHGTKVLTEDGDVEDFECILVPTKVDLGKYRVTVTKKAKDLYKIDGKNIFIATRYCYEFASYEEVILIIESDQGFSKGKIIF